MPSVSHELIPITKRGDSEQWVDARYLHKFLESKQEFANWVKARIDDFGFIEGRDYLISLSKSTGGRQAIDYTITLDMAKELSMLERSEKGKRARQYFIGVEKRLHYIQHALMHSITEAEQLFNECLSIEHEGSKWYGAAQLTLLGGRTNSGSCYKAILNRLEQTGVAKKIPHRGHLVWFVKEANVKDLLNVNRRRLIASSIVNLLNLKPAL